MPNKPKDFPVFTRLEDNELEAKITDVLLPIKWFSQYIGIKWENIEINHDSICEIVDLVERRRVYFWIYHEIDMGELNEACLLCFWIMKFNPFYDKTNPTKRVNLMIALSLFFRTVNYTALKRGVRANITANVLSHMMHALTYRDLSKESLMAIAEGLVG